MSIASPLVRFVAADAAGQGASKAVVVFVDKGCELSEDALELDASLGGAITSAIADSQFRGEVGQTREFFASFGKHRVHVLLTGAGESGQLSNPTLEDAAAHAYAALRLSGARSLELRLTGRTVEQSAHACFGALLASYRFDRYLTQPKPHSLPTINEILAVVDEPSEAALAFEPLSTLNDGIRLARDLVSEPPNVLHPVDFANRVREMSSLGLQIDVLDEAEMGRLGMDALLGVGQGSKFESQLVTIRWTGAPDAGASPIAFVGKGVTFDSGGLSLKSAQSMEGMKNDMGGAAAVVGLMLVLASRRAKVNAVGVLGLVENMPDGNAQRPGDVVRSMSGQTIEIVNTDAEGRLVLADALWYTQQQFKPKAIVDLATLTGAVVMALGDACAGMMSNSDPLADQLLAAGRQEDEELWRLPLIRKYDALHDTLVADMKNVGGHPDAGSITAALFLQRFVRDTPWAHLDIEGVVWRKKMASPKTPEGASGYGVRLLNRLVRDHYEEA